MANPQHLDILKAGVSEWNRWRRGNEHIAPDLSGADLIGCISSKRHLPETLSLKESPSKVYPLEINYGTDWEYVEIETDMEQIDFSFVNLEGVNLSRAFLRNANLRASRLQGAILNDANLTGANLHRWHNRKKVIRTSLCNAQMERIDLSYADLTGADLSGATLNDSTLHGAILRESVLDHTVLMGADLNQTDLSWATLRAANLYGANLESCRLVDTDLADANITSCKVYGVSAWNVRSTNTKQQNLVISKYGEPFITVDDLDLAQFLYLLLNNHKIRHVIDTITSRVVLILGRFTPERKSILDAIRDELRKRDYLPVLFDFDRPANRDITETISTLAHMARFVIADITDAKSIPQELMRIVPALPSVPVQPLLLASQREYGMFEHFRRYPWVLEPFLYIDQNQLLASLDSHVVGPAEKKAREQTKRV